jgi:hypothetical protein
MQSLIDENKSASGKADLKTMLGAYFSWPDYSIEVDAYVKNVAGGNWGAIPLNKLKPYHACDLVGTWKLGAHLDKLCQTEEVSGYWEIDYLDFYSRVDRNFLQLSINGFLIDPVHLDNVTQ